MNNIYAIYENGEQDNCPVLHFQAHYKQAKRLTIALTSPQYALRTDCVQLNNSVEYCGPDHGFNLY